MGRSLVEAVGAGVMGAAASRTCVMPWCLVRTCPCPDAHAAPCSMCIPAWLALTTPAALLLLACCCSPWARRASRAGSPRRAPSSCTPTTAWFHRPSLSPLACTPARPGRVRRGGAGLLCAGCDAGALHPAAGLTRASGLDYACCPGCACGLQLLRCPGLRHAGLPTTAPVMQAAPPAARPHTRLLSTRHASTTP